MKNITIDGNIADIRQGKIRQNHWYEKILVKKWFWLAFVFIGTAYPIVRSLNRELPPALPVYSKLPDYSFLDENNQRFGSEELKGKVYIANFFFTSCSTSCPKLLGHFQKIQKRVRGLGNKVALVSFTVDPNTDTPQQLFKSARKYKANPYLWKFLTESEENLESLLVSGFKVVKGEKVANKMMTMNEETGQLEEVGLIDIAHSEKFVLVDQQGQIRGYYNAEKQSVDQLMIDTGLLVNRKN